MNNVDEHAEYFQSLPMPEGVQATIERIPDPDGYVSFRQFPGRGRQVRISPSDRTTINIVEELTGSPRYVLNTIHGTETSAQVYLWELSHDDLEDIISALQKLL